MIPVPMPEKPQSMNAYPRTIAGFGFDPAAFEAISREHALVRAVERLKREEKSLPLLVVFAGGTGTGKSSLFNLAAGENVSRTGVERPMTGGAVVFADARSVGLFLDRDRLPGHLVGVRAEGELPVSGKPGHLTLVESKALPDFILVDSPDMDSLVREHARSAAELLILADHVVFFVTPEKYADRPGIDFLKSLLGWGKSATLLINKADPAHVEEIVGQFEEWGITGIPEAAVPWVRGGEPGRLGLEAAAFLESFSKRVSEKGGAIRKRELGLLKEREKQLRKSLEGALEKEEQAFEALGRILSSSLEKAREDLSSQLSGARSPGVRKRLKNEIAALYKRYDVLAPVRGFVRDTVSAPARFLGLWEKKSEGADQAARYPHENLDSSPLLYALSGYQMRVAEAVRKTLFAEAIADKRPEMSPEEAVTLMREGLGQVDQWLTGRFAELEKGLPAHKQAGIYGLSMAWGAVIVGVESIVGGGLSLFEMLLDGALAPFVTAGALEVFVVRELKSVARELADRYLDALDRVLVEQHERYENLRKRLRNP